MSDEGKTVEAQPTGNGYEFSEGKPAETEPTTEEPQALTADVLEAKLEQLRNELQEFSRKEAQSASDKRFTKVRDEVERLKQAAESVGVNFTAEQLQALQSQALLEAEPNPAGGEAQPGQPSPDMQAPPLPPHVVWANDTLAAAGVPFEAPELREFNPDDPDFRRKVLAVANKYMTSEQPTARASPEARMPTGATAGAASGNKFDELLAKQRKLMARTGRTNAENAELRKIQAELEQLAKQLR